MEKILITQKKIFCFKHVSGISQHLFYLNTWNLQRYSMLTALCIHTCQSLSTTLSTLQYSNCQPTVMEQRENRMQIFSHFGNSFSCEFEVAAFCIVEIWNILNDMEYCNTTKHFYYKQLIYYITCINNFQQHCR